MADAHVANEQAVSVVDRCTTSARLPRHIEFGEREADHVVTVLSAFQG
jgi:hypothetical protein